MAGLIELDITRVRMKVLLLLPRFIRAWLLRWIASDPRSVKRLSGTTFVTSVSMVGGSSAFVIPYLVGPRAVSFPWGDEAMLPLER